MKWTWRCLNSPYDKPRWLEQSINFLLDPIEKQWIPILLKLLQVNLGHVVMLLIFAPPNDKRRTNPKNERCGRWFSGSFAIRFRSSSPTGSRCCVTHDRRMVLTFPAMTKHLSNSPKEVLFSNMFSRFFPSFLQRSISYALPWVVAHLMWSLPFMKTLCFETGQRIRFGQGE